MASVLKNQINSFIVNLSTSYPGFRAFPAIKHSKEGASLLGLWSSWQGSDALSRRGLRAAAEGVSFHRIWHLSSGFSRPTQVEWASIRGRKFSKFITADNFETLILYFLKRPSLSECCSSGLVLVF